MKDLDRARIVGIVEILRHKAVMAFTDVKSADNVGSVRRC
jgi:hypothetical protein